VEIFFQSKQSRWVSEGVKGGHPRRSLLMKEAGKSSFSQALIRYDEGPLRRKEAGRPFSIRALIRYDE